jgi:hypothetical protein
MLLASVPKLVGSHRQRVPGFGPILSNAAV